MKLIRDRAIRLLPWLWRAIKHPVRPSIELDQVHDSLALSLRRNRDLYHAIKTAAANRQTREAK